MNGALDLVVQRLIGIDRRLLVGGLCLLAALCVFEAWMLVLRAPLAEHRALAGARLASRAAAQGAGIGGDIETLQAATAANERALAAVAPVRSNDDTVLLLIDALGALAERHTVALGRVEAGRSAALGGVTEQSFDVEVRGDYLALHAWLVDARRAVAPLAVADFALRSIEDGRRLAMTLRLAAYRTPAIKPGAP